MSEGDALTDPRPNDDERRPTPPQGLSDELVRRRAAEVLKTPPQPIEDSSVEGGRLVEYSSRSSYAGPIPPPDVLAEYERIMPGLAKRIIERSDKEQDFRHEMVRETASQNRQDITYAGRSRYAGQGAAFILGLAAIGGATYRNQALAGIIYTLTAYSAVFIVNKCVEALSAYFSPWNRKLPDSDEGGVNDSGATESPDNSSP